MTKREGKPVLRRLPLLPRVVLGGAMAVFTFCGNAEAWGEEGSLAERAHEILEDNCASCHGVEDPSVQGLDMRSFASLTRDRGKNFHPYITPGEADKSQLWRRVVNDSMPPREFEPLNDDEKKVLKQWIEQGAEWIGEEIEDRPFISNADVLDAIYRDLRRDRNVPKQQRRLRRYLTITHLHNNPNVTEATLRLHRAALSKAINSLSNNSRIILPKPIDDNETVYRIVLSDFGWDDLETWQAVLSEYPYGLKPRRGRLDGEAEFELFEEIEEEYGAIDFDGIPFIRADWFIHRALRPPLYHRLLDIPETLKGLDERLGFDREREVRLGEGRRAGVMKSGVSEQNRLVEYHSSKEGAYWESYDFAPNAERSYLMRFPLGPKGAFGEDFDRFAFDHAGGELIFNLNNGLHGYMLVDEKGARINEGPIDIVADRKQATGSPVITNGISCMGCHKAGMLDIQDEIRDGWARNDFAVGKVDAVYASHEEMNRLLEESTSDYLDSLEEAIGPFLVKGEDYKEKITEYTEPIQAVDKRYRDDVNIAAAAAELGYEDKDKLANQLEVLREIGLGPLDSGGKLPRAVWETEQRRGQTLFQEAALKLKLATPQQAN